MRLPVFPRSAVTASALALLALSCGKSSSGAEPAKDDPKKITDAPKGQIDPEKSKVTASSESLTLASSLVLLPAKDPAAQKLMLTGEVLGLDAARTRRSSDASARPLALRVEEDSFAALKEVGNIMCHFSQTRFWEQANKGKYKALIDGKKCEDGKDGGDDEEQDVPRTMEAYVEATRKEGEPLKARVKFETRDGDHYTTYQALIVVAAPPSDDNPAGVFAMYFNGYGDEALTKPLGGGFIRTKKESDKKFLLEFYTDEGDDRGEHKFRAKGGAAAILEKSGDDFTGVMTSMKDEEFTERDGRTFKTKPAFNVRFDKNNLRVAGKKVDWNQNGPEMKDVNSCFDRNKFKTMIWQYDLADTGGNLVELMGSFNIEAQVGERVLTGNAGYNGIWLPGNPVLEDGTVVKKVEWQKGKKKTTDFKIATGPGKLVKYERKSISLGELKGTDFSLWDRDGQVVVRWDGATLKKVATMSMGDGMNPPEEKPLPVPEALDPSKFDDWGLRLRSTALDAEINFPKGAALSDAYAIGYHSETVVTKASDAPVGKLLCFGACPKITMAADDVAMSMGMGGPMQDGCPPVWAKGNKTVEENIPMGPMNTSCQIDARRSLQDKGQAIAEYTWDAAGRAIKEGDTRFSITGAPSGDGDRGGHYRSGALIPESVYDSLSAETKAKWPDAAAQETTVFYRWETGTSPWSKFMGLTDMNGAPVSFDRPLDFTYQHTASNDFDGDAEGPAIGKVFRLGYSGPGQLWGMPYKFLPEIGRHGALFSLKRGAKLVEGGKDYFVAPVRGEQRLEKAADAACGKLKLDAMPKLPKPEDRKVKHPDLKGDLELRYVNGEAP